MDPVLAAEVVVEAKKPEEAANFSDLSDAMASDWIWETKTLPYIHRARRGKAGSIVAGMDWTTLDL